MRFLREFLLSVLLLGAARAEPPPVALLRPGEALTYQVNWGVFDRAGEIKVTAAAEPFDGMERTLVSITGNTRGLVRAVYRFNGEARMLFDASDGRLLRSVAYSGSGKERTKTSLVFDYAKAEAVFIDDLRPQRNAPIALPAGRPMDLVTSLIQARAWALKPGESHDLLVVFENEFYPLRITAARRETIKTAFGPKKTMLLVPRLIGPPKGMFRRDGSVRVWVSDDADRLPVRFEVKLKIGTARATLIDYRAPRAGPPDDNKTATASPPTSGPRKPRRSAGWR
jgi:hypothetical protein